MNEIVWAAIARAIGAATGADFSIERRATVGGGCINDAWTIAGGGQRYFVKVNDRPKAGMLEAEAAALAELARANAVRVPQPVCFGANDHASWLVLELIELRGRTARVDEALGGELAALHRHTADAYGWERENTIGSTPQRNPRSLDWPRFWRDCRLGFQLALARDNGYVGKLQARGEKVLDRVSDFFRGYRPAASLLHGDLWSGNAASDEKGRPVIFDPATYYGDRETDLALTELFGGFSSRFHAAYREAYPLDSGYDIRKTLYNLYHVLNHLNLFGGGYLAQAERMIEALLSELR